MAYKITSACVNCGTCEPECPVGAISAGSDAHVIDPDTCIECNACMVACPTDGAIES
ncbi:MAG: 4Fe-4S binding protein [Defluviitaleaceae bacterium]|nr:4Fe-4S binding protein [Defluviitaleaceae bacterium]